MYGLLHVQDGIARSITGQSRARPPYVIRQLLLLALLGGAYLLGYRTDAPPASPPRDLDLDHRARQMVFLNRKLAAAIGKGSKVYEVGRWWRFAADVHGRRLYLLLMYVDVLMLKHFRSPERSRFITPPQDAGLVAFVYFAVAAASSTNSPNILPPATPAPLRSPRRFHSLDLLASLAAPSPFSPPRGCRCCGCSRQYVQGYSLMFALAIGFLARAAIGPARRFPTCWGTEKLAPRSCGGVPVNSRRRTGCMPGLAAWAQRIPSTSAGHCRVTADLFRSKTRLGYHLSSSAERKRRDAMPPLRPHPAPYWRPLHRSPVATNGAIWRGARCSRTFSTNRFCASAATIFRRRCRRGAGCAAATACCADFSRPVRIPTARLMSGVITAGTPSSAPLGLPASRVATIRQTH